MKEREIIYLKTQILNDTITLLNVNRGHSALICLVLLAAA